MTDSPSSERRRGFWVSLWVTVLLGLAGVMSLAYWLPLVVTLEDTDVLESPLMMAVARQIVQGPWELYGPYGTQNPWVLMHPPLYYHLAALGAWAFHKVGLSVVPAALLAGRLLSLFGLAATLLAAYRLARLEGSPKRAGWWAMFLIVATPVLGCLPIAVRADMLGIGFQTTGLWLVFSALEAASPKTSRLLAAFALFGLAACTKQHFVVGVTVATGLCVVARWRGRLPAKAIERGLLVYVAILALIYGGEELLTEGRMSRAVFLAAANVRRVHPSGWGGMTIVAIAVLGRSAGILALATAASLAGLRVSSGVGRWVVVILGTGVVGLIAVAAVADIHGMDWRLGALAVVSTLAALVLVLPVCLWLAPRSGRGRGLGVDLVLSVACLIEVALMLIMSRLSTGAWVNYGIQAVVFASIPTARLVARALDDAPSRLLTIPLILAAPVAPAVLGKNILNEVGIRNSEQIALNEALNHLSVPVRDVFFVDRPGYNRCLGRVDLVYDPWLYPVFESIGRAQPRSVWLRRALYHGSVRAVFLISDDPHIDGIPSSLRKFDYFPTIASDPFYVWERVARSGQRDPNPMPGYNPNVPEALPRRSEPKR